MTAQGTSRLGLAAALLLIALKAASLATEAAPALVPTLGTLAVAALLLRLSVRSRSPRWLRALVIPLGLAMAAFIAMTLWVNFSLARAAESFQPLEGPKVWSTRGLTLNGPEIVKDGEQNSVEAIARAFDQGAAGVEVDVFYDADLADFVVSHDRPYNLRNGSLLMLGDLLETLGDRGSIWLDWKKLRHLDADQMTSALEALDRYTAKGGLKSRFFVEGEDPFNLSRCRHAGFPTIYDTHPLPDANPFSRVVIDFYKAVYHFGGFTVLSMETGTADRWVFGSSTRKAVQDVPLFLYHAPADEELLAGAIGEDNVQVIILRDQSKDLFRWSADVVRER